MVKGKTNIKMFCSIFLTTLALLSTKSVRGQSDPLILTPLIASGNITEARNLSVVLTLPNSSHNIPSRPSYSGFITVNETYNSNLFFWFFPATSAKSEDEKMPIVLWLDGGPGVSNFVTIFSQNGPFVVKSSTDSSFSLEPRLEDWTVNRSIIYLENPVDVGFSFTSNSAGLPQTSEEAAENSLEFLRQFFLLFPEHTTDPLFIVGQSYGGHFAPPVGTAIHKRNEENQQPSINFQGIMLLAPWTNPRVQVDFYADYLYQTGLIDDMARSKIVAKQELIKNLINEKKYIEAKDVWTDMLINPGSTFSEASGFSTALNLLEDQLDPNNFLFINYVELPEFRQAVHVGNSTYTLVSTSIQNSMAEEFMASKSEHVEEILRQKYKVIVATGQLDLTVISKGVERMLNDFEFNGQNEWRLTNRTVWNSADGHVAGYKKERCNLSMYLIRNAGHMLTGDQPAWNLELVNDVLIGNGNEEDDESCTSTAGRNLSYGTFASLICVMYLIHFGYARIVLAVIAFYFMQTNYVVAGWCYIISALLDSVDGHAARAFNQSTKFGAMLDQLTDRCGTMGLLVTLSYFYPNYMFWFQLSMAIDVACHWIYMQASTLQGKSSHKFVDPNENPIMRLYYQKDILTFMCCGNELFYSALYLLNFTTGPTILGLSLLKVAAILSAPVAIVKTLISLLHAYVAAQNLSIIDANERAENRKKELSKKPE